MQHQSTFRLPFTELHPHYKKILQFARKYGWAMLEGEALLDPTLTTDHQIEAFRCAMRELSDERDCNLIIDDSTAEPRWWNGVEVQDVIFELAPKGHPGSLPEVWDEKDEAVANAVATPGRIIN